MLERSAARSANRERGNILVLFALILAPTLLALGLAVDFGTAYLAHASLANAVDAGALAAARTTRNGDASGIALRVARTNYPGGGHAQYTYSTSPGTGSGLLVEVRGDYEAPTYFSRLFGRSAVSVHAVASALRVPVDVSLLLDTTDSLNRTGVLNVLKDETQRFLDHFDDGADRIGIIGFSTVATEAMPMQSWFTSTGHSAIHGLASLVDTNLDEGLRLAKRQLETTQSREGVPRYVVLVTDGRPTAFRGTYPVPLIAPLGLDGVIAAEDDGQSYRGLFRPTDGRRIESINALGQLVTSSNDSTAPSPLPELLSDGSTDPAAVIRSLAEAKALERAAAIRASGAKIIVVAIQPPNPSHPLDTPDLAYLDRIANVGGISDPNGSRGEVFVADPDTLADTLATVAGRMLVTRLAPRLI